MIEDVQSGQADFDHVLVYDVSRWGRFQDVDESAHYEFVCKQKGVKVAYCAEQFDNDGTLLSSIVKNIKRVMAAEYSRELSVKVHTGQSRIASLGYRVGGPLTFGLRRELIDESQRPKCRLLKGERKSLQTDRVRLQTGSEDEAAIVRWIFNQFVEERRTDAEIARELNRAQVANHHQRPWTDHMIHAILKNENYIGNLVYNRTSRRLGQRLVNNPRHLWIRGSAVVDPMVDRDIFARAQKIMAERYISIPEDQMLRLLRVTLARKGKLSLGIINNAPGLPSVSSYVKHFGSLRKAYALIGFTPSYDCDWIDSRSHWSEVLAEHAEDLVEALSRDSRIWISLNEHQYGVTLNDKVKLTFIVVRHMASNNVRHGPYWRLYRARMPSGFIVLVRLDDTNKAIQDYALLPSPSWSGRYLTLSDVLLDRLKVVRAKNIEALTPEIKKILAMSSRSALAKKEPQKKREKLGRAKA